MKTTFKPAALLLCTLFFFAAFLQAQPNNDCANAIQLTPDSACTVTTRLTGQTLTGATNQAYTITSACGQLATARDVWYYFVARSKYPTINISNQGSGWGGINSVRTQILEGTCGSFTEKACGTGAAVSPTLTNPLTEGATYYVRIHKNTASTITANHTFDICVTDPFEKGNRMNEVFIQTVLSGPSSLSYPWEVTYAADDSLWITESRTYRVYKVSAANGGRRMVLDLALGSTFYTAPADVAFNRTFSMATTPQGGMAGLALHPNFMDGTVNENNSVYISYIHSQTSSTVFTNRLVKFTYSTVTNRLESPVALCDTLPGSNDHNSQRIIIAPITVGGPKYLFYASGDMGAGQGSNVPRTMKVQLINSYEGKILRFNLMPDGDTDPRDSWIPNDNPYNSLLGGSVQSAVWNIGMRNNQGFAYDADLNILYGSSHGAYSDDEINIIEGFKNYGHPLIMGYVGDGNYDGDTSVPSTRYSAGAPFNTVGSGYSTCPPISSEASRRTAIDASSTGLYMDPIFSAYPGPTGTGAGTPRNIWSTTTGANASWPSEGWSGMDIYTDKIIPGWKKSLLVGGLKWGRVIKLKLGAAGNTTLPSNLTLGNSGDTVTYFQSVNRYRDIAFGPNGKDMFIVMDNNAATSGPGTNNPIVAACAGCIVKYSFIGYQAATAAPGVSLIPKTVDVTTGPDNTCNNGTAVTIDGTNNFLWVPITGPDGNIMAEINAMGQSLGAITSSFYKNSSGIRVAGGIRYLDRNITITPAVTTFTTPVKVRLYISTAELNALIADPLSSVTSINDLRILKNNDACGGAIASSTAMLTTTNTLAPDLQHGTSGYVLQTNVSSFSSFYFAANNVLLPVDLITFTGSLQNNTAALLNWNTENEMNVSQYVVERSTDGRNFAAIGTVAARGNNSTGIFTYSFTDYNAADQGVTAIFYRLKITDVNNAFKHSGIVKIVMPGSKGLITVSPNPAANELKAVITSPAAAKANWQIIDNFGRTVLQNAIMIKKGDNTLTININNLSTGAYYLRINGGDVDIKTKFQKL